MKITRMRVPLNKLVSGFKDNKDEGVSAYSGLLDIRPAYQREFIYKDAQRDAVINTVLKNFPLNTLYWVKTGQTSSGEETYEVLDGQQRILSICQYASNYYSVKVNTNPMLLNNLSNEQRTHV